MFAETSWLYQLKRTYIGNATATRDLRIQLRGGRAAFLFTLYLVVMAFVLLMVYAGSLGEEGRYSLATAQSNLQTFYHTTLISLGVVITIVAPSMGAFSIVTEKQRRSLDLVFSAPTEPKYYLVGKLISSYRYVWLLLVLSLPFCAVSVTLGGATWAQLFLTFLLFSFYGLVCVAFGLLMSTLCSRVLPALIWTYLAVACYFGGTVALVGISIAGSRSFLEQVNPFSSLNPITFPFIADQKWPVFGRDIPTWILSILLQLLVVKFIILGAGSLLAPGHSKEIRGLRIHGLIYPAAVAFLIGYTIDAMFRSMLIYGGTYSGLTPDDVLQVLHGRGIFTILFFIGLIIVPYLSSFGFNDLRRHRPNGFFDFRQAFTGRPSGHLPYLLLLFVVCTAAYSWGAQSAVTTSFVPFARTAAGTAPPTIESFDPLSIHFLMYVLLSFDLWLIAFLIGWFVAGKTPVLSRGRTFSLFFFVLALILPTALFAIVSPEDSQSATGIWSINPMAGVISSINSSGIAGIHGLALLCVCVILIVITLPNVKKLSSQPLEKPQGVPQ